MGDVIGKYHPHGDTAVYDTIVRMAQDFSMRYPLVDGQGNFGSIDGDPPAAMRYTEIRMTRLAHQMLEDLEKETVDLVPNYDESLTEPAVLPAKFPALLINGSSGIAVGMATNIPAPQPLRSRSMAIKALIDDPEITCEELMAYIPGPDFPTAGIIYGTQGIREAYETGRGIIRMRARVTVEEDKKTGRETIVVTETALPGQQGQADRKDRRTDQAQDRSRASALSGTNPTDGACGSPSGSKKTRWPASSSTSSTSTPRWRAASASSSWRWSTTGPQVLNLKEILEHFILPPQGNHHPAHPL